MDDSADFEAANEWTAKINKTAIVSGASKRRRRGVDGGRRGAAHARLPRSHSCPSPPPSPQIASLNSRFNKTALLAKKVGTPWGWAGGARVGF